MYFEEIPFYDVFSEIREKVRDIVLYESDTAEFLGCSEYGLQNINNLYGTKYEDIIPAMISCISKDSYGMFGKIFRFNLVPALRNHIREDGLTCIFSENGELFLENLCLYRGENIIFSCCSHEAQSSHHMAEIDNSLTEIILSEVDKTIRDMPLHRNMKLIADKLSSKPETEIRREICIISDLCRYVDREKEYFVYSPPKYECDFRSFKRIAESYLTEDTFAVISPLCSYSELQPQPVAKSADDVLKGIGKDTPQFSKSKYYNAVNREVKMIEYILGYNK